MRKPLRIVLGVAATLVSTVLIAAGVINWLADRKRNRLVALPPLQVTFAPAEDQLERGEYLFKTRGCMECHGADGAGHVLIDDADSGLFVRTPNITTGGAGPARSYSDTDWMRALRHGVKPSGSPLWFMPSEDYAGMTTADIAAIAAYVRSLPPAQTGSAEFKVPMPVKVLYVFGGIKDAAEKIDHTAAPAESIPDDPLARGKYVAQVCTGCHGRDFAGGPIPGAPPSWPEAPNLTTAPDSAMARYTSAEQFKTMFRTGKRPDGSAVSEIMPFKSLTHMSDAELDALFAYLKAVPGEENRRKSAPQQSSASAASSP